MYITYLLLAASVLFSLKAFNDQSFKEKWMFNAYAIIHERQYYRIISHAFIHADIAHLAFNMFALFMFAIQITPKVGYNYGHLSLEPHLVSVYEAKGYLYFGALYLGGILASNVYALYKHRNNPYYNSLGASGAVSAVIFAYIILNPMDKMGFFPFPPIIPAFIFGPLLLIMEYYLAKRGGTGIAHDAHIGGALFGIIFICLVDPSNFTNFLSSFGL